MDMIAPAEYQPALHRRFALLLPRLRAWLGEAARIEHIGASSIPGALSKGDLDICVIVPAGQHERAVSRLVEQGYVVKQGTLRTECLCMLEGEELEHAVQVVAEGSEFMDFLHFRDRLRADPALVAAYNEVKLAAVGLPMAEYRARKSAFIDKVLSAA